MSTELGNEGQNIDSLKKKLESSQIKPEELEAITKSLESPETLEAIKKVVSDIDAQAIGEAISKKPQPTEIERKILALLGRIHPVEMLDTQIKLTGSESERVKDINGKIGTLDLSKMETWTDADFVKFQEALKSRPEFQITKGELQKYYEIFAKIEPKGPNAEKIREAKNTLKKITDAILFTMLTNGMTIDSPTDIAFLKAFGPEKVQTFIKEQEASGALKEGKFIVKTTGETVSIVPADAANLKGMDISQINSLKVNPANPEQTIEQVKKLAGMGKEKLQNLVKSLSGSKNSVLKFFGELLEGLFGFLGISSKSDSIAESHLNTKQTVEHLKDMLNPNNGRYNITSTIDYTSDGGQKFLTDIKKLGLGKDVPERGPDGKYVYNQKLISATVEFSKMLGITPPVDSLNADGLTRLLKKIEENLAPAPAKLPSQQPEQVVEKPTRHTLADTFDRFKGITNPNEILKIGRTIRDEIGGRDAVIRLQEELGFKKNPAKGEEKADGSIGEKTVKAYRLRYPDGNIPKPAAK